MTRTLHARAGLSAIALATALLCAACSSSDVDTTERNTAGEVVEGGEVGVERLQVGDCITKGALEGTPSDDASASAEAVEIESLPAVPCSEPHAGEVVLVDEDFYADLPERPDDEALFEQSTDPCIDAIAQYTGFDLNDWLSAEEEPDVEEIFAPFTLVPNPQSWEANDRSMICIAASVESDLETIVERTGSAKVG